MFEVLLLVKFRVWRKTNIRLFAFLEGTVADNVRYGPSLQGKTLTEKEALGYLQQADLDESFLHKSIVGLSVGQAQRVHLLALLLISLRYSSPLSLSLLFHS